MIFKKNNNNSTTCTARECCRCRFVSLHVHIHVQKSASVPTVCQTRHASRVGFLEKKKKEREINNATKETHKKRDTGRQVKEKYV